MRNMFWNTSQNNKIEELEKRCRELEHIGEVVQYGYQDIIRGLRCDIAELRKENKKLKKKIKKLKRK